ncbi:unnamed protein product [Didymodactylos carnosus]|nr:unnamed protein product [Didymodactylos carnosus]
MQLRRHQHNPGFYHQLNNSSLSNCQLVHPRVLVQPVQFALPHAPRLLSIRPLIQRFVFRGAIANRGWLKRKPFNISKNQFNLLKLSGTSSIYGTCPALLNALNLDIQFVHEGRLHSAEQFQLKVVRKKGDTYVTPTRRETIKKIYVLYIRSQPVKLN